MMMMIEGGIEVTTTVSSYKLQYTKTGHEVLLYTRVAASSFVHCRPTPYSAAKPFASLCCQ
jgi:hypothetical protein